MTLRRTALFLASAVVFSMPAMAQDYKTVLDLPEGRALLSVSATERTEIEQDLLVASLRYEAENKDPKALQNEINGAMKKALDLARAAQDVKVSTQQYYVYPYDPEPPRPLKDGTVPAPSKEARIWRGNQGIELKSGKADELLQLVGKLQDLGLSVSGLSYTVSPELMDATQESLLEAALGKLKAKAERAAKALGKSQAELREINVDIGGNYQPVMMRAMAMDAGGAMEKMAAPVAAPGESEVTLTVNARALLIP